MLIGKRTQGILHRTNHRGNQTGAHSILKIQAKKRLPNGSFLEGNEGAPLANERIFYYSTP